MRALAPKPRAGGFHDSPFHGIGVVLSGEGRVLLVEHRKLGCWLYPGGHLCPDEDPAEAVVREVAEETGITCRIIAEPRFSRPGTTVPPRPSRSWFSMCPPTKRSARVSTSTWSTCSLLAAGCLHRNTLRCPAVSGYVNRIKMIKWQMYGRASFTLLRKRVLLATWRQPATGDTPITGQNRKHRHASHLPPRGTRYHHEIRASPESKTSIQDLVFTFRRQTYGDIRSIRRLQATGRRGWPCGQEEVG
jgi:hypothetical protein